jgi:hypothetical protein
LEPPDMAAQPTAPGAKSKSNNSPLIGRSSIAASPDRLIETLLDKLSPAQVRRLYFHCYHQLPPDLQHRLKAMTPEECEAHATSLSYADKRVVVAILTAIMPAEGRA